MKVLSASTTLALAVGLGMHPSGPAVAQQIQFACDENDDGFVDATESRLCTDAEFDEIAPGEQVLTEEQLFAVTKGEQDMSPTFSEIDENGDGQISRDEWVGFSDRRSDVGRRVREVAPAGDAAIGASAAGPARRSRRPGQ